VVPSPAQALILVADDDVLERMGAAYMFSDAGYRVLEAGSADVALRFLDGAGLARLVAERWPKVGILMTSGRPFPSHLPLGVRFHAKPYEPVDVLRDAREMQLQLE
jgi:CheY-like chemotaxis protein